MASTSTASLEEIKKETVDLVSQFYSVVDFFFFWCLNVLDFSVGFYNDVFSLVRKKSLLMKCLSN